MIVAQNGGSIRNLINTTLPNSVTCRSTNDSVECTSADEILTLTISPCNRTLIVTVTDTTANGNVLVKNTLHSSPQSQRISYTVQNNQRELFISVQAVSHNSTNDYYIISLNASATGLQIPSRSVPLVCGTSTPMTTTGNFYYFQ